MQIQCVTVSLTPAQSDEDAAGQLLDVFSKNKVRLHGTLRRTHFSEVKGGDFLRGLSSAVQRGWISVDRRRHVYQLTKAGFAATLRTPWQGRDRESSLVESGDPSQRG